MATLIVNRCRCLCAPPSGRIATQLPFFSPCVSTVLVVDQKAESSAPDLLWVRLRGKKLRQVETNGDSHGEPDTDALCAPPWEGSRRRVRSFSRAFRLFLLSIRKQSPGSGLVVGVIKRKKEKCRWEFRWPAQPFFQDCFRDGVFAFRIETRSAMILRIGSESPARRVKASRNEWRFSW